ncbi:MAG: hypothetical protein ABEJ42_07600 [Halobacteriaceae archaeon]
MRGTAVLVALLGAVVFVSFPIVSPPPDPPDRLAHSVAVTSAPTDPERVARGDVVAYENLSERGQTLFDRARALPHGEAYTVPVGAGAPDFEYDEVPTLLVTRDGTAYRLQTRRRWTSPDAGAVALRLGSLTAGICCGALGGYWRLNGTS